MAELSYCARQVKDLDYDRFLTALFSPDAIREDLIALYAFNIELAKVRETVSEPLIGRMRLQFWRDALPGLCAGTPPSHEIAQALAPVIMRHKLPEVELHALIDARETDIDPMPPKDMTAMCDYAERSSSTLIRMAVRIFGVDPTQHDALIKDAGIAIALVGLVRAIPFQASTGFVTLPSDLCKAAGLDPTEPQQWPKNPDIRVITGPMLDEAADHLERARANVTTIPKRARTALLPLSLAARSLTALRRVGGDPSQLQPDGVGRHFTLLWRALVSRP